jgi:hypothetical protein
MRPMEPDDDFLFRAHAALWDWLAWLAQEMREEAEVALEAARRLDPER